MVRPPRVAWVFDWFAYYAAGVLDALASRAELFVVSREHGLELGQAGIAVEARRELLPDSAAVRFVRGRQADPSTVVAALRARRAVRAFRPDVVHTQDHSDWRLAVSAEFRETPSVVTIHDIEPHLGWIDSRNGLQRRVENHIRRRADVLCVHGETLVPLVERQPWYRGQPVRALPMGALGHAASVRPLPTNPTVLFFGRLEYYKGLDIFVRAVELASSSVPRLRAIIAGEGEAAASARGMVTNPSLFDWRERFIADSEVADLFAEASLVVLPYREASQSGVVPVAFANGRAVVATRVGGLAVSVHDGVNGVLVDSGDAESIACVLRSVLTDQSTLRALTLGAEASLESGDQSADAVAEAHLDVYRLAVRTHQGGRRE